MKLWLLLGSATALIAALAGFGVWVSAPRVALQKAKTVQAQATTVVATAQGQLITQAVQTTSREVIHEQTITTTLPVVEHRIAQAPGSDDYVDPRSADAFLGGVCEYRPADAACGPQDPGRQPLSPAVPAGAAPGPQD
jgi:hypothetical protein